MLKLATRRRVRTGLIGGYGTVACLVARIALPHVGLLLQIGYAACSLFATATCMDPPAPPSSHIGRLPVKCP